MEYFESVNAIRIQYGIERHAFNARSGEVRYAFSPSDFGLVDTAMAFRIAIRVRMTSPVLMTIGRRSPPQRLTKAKSMTTMRRRNLPASIAVSMSWQMMMALTSSVEGHALVNPNDFLYDDYDN